MSEKDRYLKCVALLLPFQNQPISFTRVSRKLKKKRKCLLLERIKEVPESSLC